MRDAGLGYWAPALWLGKAGERRKHTARAPHIRLAYESSHAEFFHARPTKQFDFNSKIPYANLQCASFGACCVPFQVLYAFWCICMHSQPSMAFPEISSAAAFNEAAKANGWPALCDETLSFDHSVLSDLLKLWQSEAEGGVPLRNALTARKLQPFMRNIAIYERIGEGAHRRYRLRLMGSGIVEYYGELTGKFVDEAIPQKFQDRWYALTDTPLISEKPVRFLLRADTFDKSYMTAEYLCAPLKADGGLTKFVLVGIIFDGKRPWNTVEAEARQKLGLDKAE